MNLFSVYGTIGLKADEFNKALSEAAQKGEKFGDKVSAELMKPEKAMARMAEAVQKDADAIQTKLLKFSAIAGAALGAIAVFATNAGMSFEAQMSKVEAISGATADEMVLLGDKAKEMGAKTKFSATESGQAFEYMAMAGWKTEDMLAGIEGIMNLAAASGENLALTSDIVTDALTAMGLKADDTGHFVDVLAAAASNSNTNVAMLGESFKYVAPVAGALGFDIEDLGVALGLMANSGVKGSMAGTALRTTLSNLLNPTSDQADAMRKLNISLTDSQGNMKPFGAIMDDMRVGFSRLTDEEKAFNASIIAGDRGMSGLLAIVNAAPEDFNRLSSALNSAEGTARRMADTMINNLAGSVTIFKSGLEGLGIKIYETIQEPLKNAVGIGINMLRWLSDNLTSVITVVKTAAIAVGGFTAAWTIGNTIQKAVTAIKAAHTAIAAATAVTGTNTVVLGANAAAEATRTAAMAAGMTVNTAGQIITKAGTVATAAETAALLASTGALTTKQLLVGVLTGKIGLATAAQHLWNLAMSMNPIGMIVAAIALFAAALVGLNALLNKETEEQKASRESTEKVVEANKELTNTIEQSGKAYADRESDIMANVGASEKLADKVFELVEEEKRLAAQGEDTAAIRQKISAAVDIYNESMGESILLYDEESSSINKTRDDLEKLAQTRIAEAKHQAARERAAEVAKQLMIAEENLGKTQQQRAAIEENAANGMYKTRGAAVEAAKQMVQLTSDEEELTAQIQELTVSLENVTDTMVEMEVATRSVASAQEDVVVKAKSAADIQSDITAKREAEESDYTEYLIAEANKRKMTVKEFTDYLGDEFIKRYKYLDEEGLKYLAVRDAQKVIADERKDTEHDYTVYLMEEATARKILVDDFTAYLGNDIVKHGLMLDDEVLKYLEIRDKQAEINDERAMAEKAYTLYLTEESNARGMAVNELTELMGAAAVKNMESIEGELEHAIEVNKKQKELLDERVRAEEAHTVAMKEFANSREMTLKELEEAQKNAAKGIEDVNKNILSAYDNMTAGLKNVNREIKLDTETTWKTVIKNQQDTVPKVKKYADLMGEAMKAGVSLQYLEAIGATGPESIPLLEDMMATGFDTVLEGQAQWEEAWRTVPDAFVTVLSDDTDIQNAIKEMISGQRGIGPTLQQKLQQALDDANFAGLFEAVPDGAGEGIARKTYVANDATMEMIKAMYGAGKGGLESSSPSELFARLAESIPQGIAKGIERMMQVVKNAITDLVNQARLHMSSAVSGSDFSSIGANMVQGMINGVNSKASSLTSAVKNLAQKATGGAKTELQIASPSKVFTWIGEMTGQGFIDGVKHMASRVQGAISSMMYIPSAQANIYGDAGMETMLAGSSNSGQSFEAQANAFITAINRMGGIRAVVSASQAADEIEPFVSEIQGGRQDAFLRSVGALT